MHFSTDIYECSAFQERANNPESWFLAVTMKPSVPAAAASASAGVAEQKLPQKTVSYKIYLRPEDRKRFSKKYNEADKFYAERIQNLSLFPAAERPQQLREIERAKGVAHDVWFPAFLSTVTVPPNSELLQLVQNPYFSRVRPKVDANLHPYTPWIFLSPDQRGARVEKVRKAEPDAGIMPHAAADQRLKDLIRSDSGSSMYNTSLTPPDAGGASAAAAAAAGADELTQPLEEKSRGGGGAGTGTRAEEAAARAESGSAGMAAAAAATPSSSAAKPGNQRLLRRDSSLAKRRLAELHSSPPGGAPKIPVETGPKSKKQKTRVEVTANPYGMWERRPSMPTAMDKDSAAAPGPVPMSHRSAS